MKKYFFAENVFIFQFFLHSKLFFYKHSVLLGQPQYAHDFSRLSLILCLQNMLKFSPWGHSKSTSKYDEFRAYEWPLPKAVGFIYFHKNPFKMMIVFYFIWKAAFFLKIFIILPWLFWLYRKTALIRKLWYNKFMI